MEADDSGEPRHHNEYAELWVTAEKVRHDRYGRRFRVGLARTFGHALWWTVGEG